MGDGAQIYLSKPGGQRQGPYTLAQIKQDLAANKYRDTDYWAWHEGRPDWVPLYNLPGISEKGAPAPPAPAPKPAPAPIPPRQSALESSLAAPVPDAAPDEVSLPPEVASGLPFPALDHIFLFTTGDGPAVWHSPEVTRMLKGIIGTERELIRENVRRDVVSGCAPTELLKPDGTISDAVWRAMAAHQPDLVQQARKRLYRVCVRTFRIEADTVAALVLFYNKAKL